MSTGSSSHVQEAVAPDSAGPADDSSSLWEKLWGPGRDLPCEHRPLSDKTLTGAPETTGPDSGPLAAPPPTGDLSPGPAGSAGPAPTPDPPPSQDEGGMVANLRSHLEAVLSEQMLLARLESAADLGELRAGLRAHVEGRLRDGFTLVIEMLEARYAELGAQARTQLAALRSEDETSAIRQIDDLRAEMLAAASARVEELRADLREQLLSLRTESSTGIEARLSGTEAELKGRFDALADGVAAAQAEVQQKLALLDATLAEIDGRVLDQLDALAGWVVAEATRAARRAVARPAIAALVREELHVLQDEVRRIDATVVQLQRRLPAKARVRGTARAE